MIVNGINIDEIVITNDRSEVLAVISDDEIIEKDGYQVVCALKTD